MQQIKEFYRFDSSFFVFYLPFTANHHAHELLVLFTTFIIFLSQWTWEWKKKEENISRARQFCYSIWAARHKSIRTRRDGVQSKSYIQPVKKWKNFLVIKKFKQSFQKKLFEDGIDAEIVRCEWALEC